MSWQALTKAIKKKIILEMVINVWSLLEAWCKLKKFSAHTQETAYDRAKGEFERLERGVSESVAAYFTRVHVVSTKLMRHQATTLARKIKRRVLSGLTSRFPDEVSLYTVKGNFDLKDAQAGLARVEIFQSGQERRNASVHVLAVGHAGGGSAGARGEARSRGRNGKRFAKRNDVV